MRFAPFVALILCGGPVLAAAQTPLGADTLSQRAASESLAVLRTLDDAVKQNAKDAAAWYRRGMVAWALSIRANTKPSLSGLDASRLNRTADESLREAVELDPDNVRARIALGQRLLTSTVTVARVQATGHFDRALEVARRSGDRTALADAAIEVGRVYWRRYESQSHRRLETDSGLVRSIEEAVNVNPLTRMGGGPVRVTTEAAVNIIHSALIDVTQAMSDVGLADYRHAEDLFREASSAAPGNARAFRQLAMLLAEKNRWTELVTVARERTARQSSDHWGWLALGLAYHRGGESRAAQAAFDSAMAKVDVRERARLTGLQRVLRPADTAAYLRSSPEARAASDQTFWMMADQLWSRPGNEQRNELFARVAYSELRWTIEELGLRGADSDRGNIYIRFGPPDVIAKLGPRTFQDDITIQSREGARRPTDYASELAEVTFWDWDTGLVVVFWGTPGFGTARIAGDDKQHIDYLIDKTPATWYNSTGSERVIPMPAFVARFRAPGDSVDLYIAAQPPVNEIRAAASANTAIRASLWIFGRDVPNAYSDSLILRTASHARWIYRVPPSTYLYRVEATADAAMVAGSVSAWVAARGDSVTGFATRGFGISDLLLGARAAAAPTARRWTDVEITPTLAPVARAATLTVLWENYELAAADGKARYEVAVTIQRERSAAGRVAAEILDAIAGTVGIDNRSNDRVTMRLEREMPHATAFMDRVDIGLSTTPPGQYRLELRITDRVTNRTTTRATGLTIRQ